MGNRPQRRHLEVITPPVLDRPAPTTRCRIEASRWDWFFVNVLRPAWGYRVEVVVLVVALGAAGWLRSRFGDVGGGVAFLGLVIGLLAWKPSRSFTVRLFHGSRLHRRWSLAVRHAGLATYNDRIPRPVAVRLIPPGDQLRVRIPPGSAACELKDKASVIAACLGVRELKVNQDAANAKFAEVIVVRRDPLSGGEALSWPNLCAASLSMWEPIPVGIDEMGAVVWMCLVESNLLAGGLPGAGKSVVLQMVVATAALDPSVELTLFDGKLVELAFWRGIASRFVGPSLEEANEVLR
jgi:hypothetical protein